MMADKDTDLVEVTIWSSSVRRSWMIDGEHIDALIDFLDWALKQQALKNRAKKGSGKPRSALSTK